MPAPGIARLALRRGPLIAAVSLLVLVLLPLSAAAPFNAPFADDLFYAVMTRDKGFWRAQYDWLLGWQGRYTSTAVLSLYGQAGFALVYPLLPLLLAAITLAAAWMLARAVEQDRARAAAMVSLGFSAWVLGAPSLREAFCWGAAAVTYTLGGALAMACLACLLRPGRANALAAGLCAVAAVGCNETLAVMLPTLLAAGIALTRRQRGVSRQAWIGALLAASLGALVVAAAPGNRLRAREYPDGGRPALALQVATVGMAQHLARLATGPLVPLSAVALFCLAKNGPATPGRERFVPLAALAAMGAGHLVSAVAMGQQPPPRALNAIDQVAVMGWLAWLRGVAPRLAARCATRQPILRYLAVAAAAASVAWAAWWAGGHVIDAARWGPAYRQALIQRAQRIARAQRDGIQDIVLPPLPRRPRLVDHGDLKPDPRHFVNAHFAAYHRLRSVRTQP